MLSNQQKYKLIIRKINWRNQENLCLTILIIYKKDSFRSTIIIIKNNHISDTFFDPITIFPIWFINVFLLSWIVVSLDFISVNCLAFYFVLLLANEMDCFLYCYYTFWFSYDFDGLIMTDFLLLFINTLPYLNLCH